MNRAALIKLRERLAQLYADLTTIRRVLADAGLNAGAIDLGGSVLNCWHAVLAEAQKAGQLAQLVEVAQADYPQQREELQALLLAVQGNGPLAAGTPTPAPPVVQPAPPQPTAPVEIETPLRTIPIALPRAVRLTAIETQLLSALFRQADRLAVLREFTDGRTPTRVLLVRPIAADGVEELPLVVKLGPQALIQQEWQATQRHVLHRLPGFIAVQGEPIYLVTPVRAAWGALRYGQVGDGVFSVESLAQYSLHASTRDIWHLLENRLFRQLNKLWQATLSWEALSFQHSYDGILPVNLVVEQHSANELSPQTPVTLLDGQRLAVALAPAVQRGDWVRLEHFIITESAADAAEITLNVPQRGTTRASYRLRVQGQAGAGQYAVDSPCPPLVGRVIQTRQTLLRTAAQPWVDATLDLTAAELALPNHPSVLLPNPLLALPALCARTGEAKFATIHGDLNLRNILVDPEARTAHIIDCAAARQDHVLQDLLRMERDIITELAAQIFFRAGLPATTIYDLYHYVHAATRGQPHPAGQFALPKPLDAALHPLFIMLVTLRQTAREYLQTPGQWAEYYTGLILHLVGALKFRDLDAPAPGQQPKTIAFWGAATMLGLLQGQQSPPAIEWRWLDLTAPD